MVAIAGFYGFYAVIVHSPVLQSGAEMNLFAQRKPAAFTLIELIVVILIIATLAALIMTGASSLIDRARKVQIKNDVTQIVNSVNAYYTEYGKYPMVDANQGTDTLYGKSGTAPGNEDICYVLRAINAGVNATPSANYLNPRQIVFLSGRDSSRARSGFTTTATTDTNGNAINAGAFVDPYGNAYMVAIDGSYDGATVDALPYTDIPYATGNAVRTGCFAESFGKDGKQGKDGNKAYSGSDDILSWQ
jgi:prepilin-type N-terminal cleavage/methylation domain-containing protein